jgi:hypothetical protein
MTEVTRPGPGCDTFQSWGRSLGAADAEKTAFDLVVQGNTTSAIYVASLHPRVIAIGPERRGFLATCPTAGVVTPRHIRISLDEPGGQYITHGQDSPFGQGYTLANGDSEVFDLSAFTRHSYVRWVLDISAIVGGRSVVVTVFDHGKPFVTSAYPPHLPRYTWDLAANWTQTRPVAKTHSVER